MCNRYSANISADEIEQAFPVARTINSDRSHPRNNVAPNTFNPVICRKDNQTTLDFMRWGLIEPGHSKLSTFNCRVESLIDLKPLWKCAKTNRGVAVMDGYFEWQYDSADKIPYYFYATKPAFALTIWQYEGYSIVTRPASKRLTRIHPRMPVLVSQETAIEWMEGKWPQSLELVDDFIDPSFYRVSTRVNKVGNQGEDLIKEEKHMDLTGWFSKKTEQAPSKKVKTENKEEIKEENKYYIRAKYQHEVEEDDKVSREFPENLKSHKS